MKWLGSVWEAEVNAASDRVDTLLYARNLCQELRYPMGSSNRVLIDNESAIHWLKGESISASTKHVEARQCVKPMSLKFLRTSVGK
jgi:hypothetical protein